MAANDVDMEDTSSQNNISQLESFRDLSIVGTIGTASRDALTPQAAGQVVDMINNGRGPRLGNDERLALSTLADNSHSTENLVFTAATQGNTPAGHMLALSGILRANNDIQETWHELQEAKAKLEETTTELQEAGRDIRLLQFEVDEEISNHGGETKLLQLQNRWQEQLLKDLKHVFINIIGPALPDPAVRQKLTDTVEEAYNGYDEMIKLHFQKQKEAAARHREQHGDFD